MFPLHDRTRRWICRSGFLLGGVLPLAAVIGYSAVIRTAIYKEAVRAALKAELGVDVRFDKVSHPRPGVTLLSGLELLDRQTEESLLRARLLEIGPHTQTLVASQGEVNAPGLDRLWLVLQRRQREANQPAVQISAAELTLRWPQGVQTLVDCNAQLECAESEQTASATFQVAGADADSPARLGLRWNTSTDADAAKTLKLETGGTPLPCALLAALVHCENWLGPNGAFQGTIRIEETSAGRQIEVSGQIDGIDLQSVVGDHFPHRLTGTCSLSLERATLRDGRLEEATGAIHAGPGIVSRSLLHSAAEALRMHSKGATHGDNDAAEYEQLAATFAWDAKGLTIHGQCDESEPGTVLRSADGGLLTESSEGALPVTALVQALVPDSRVQVPATRQTDWLLRALPLPEVQSGDAESAPHARLRGGTSVK